IRRGVQLVEADDLQLFGIGDPIKGPIAEEADVKAGRERVGSVFAHVHGELKQCVRLAAETSWNPQVLTVGVLELANELQGGSVEAPLQTRPILNLLVV